ncbi:MAG: spore coat protein CotJB [Clostridia bacterium]|nr:spore coat protein CotJB [Clostridia bacterium]
MMNYDTNNLREMMLKQVYETGFAVVDSNLYLDTHPCDTAAINYNNQAAEAYRCALREYEAQFGPLRAYENRNAQYWTWVNNPWPWEGGC